LVTASSNKPVVVSPAMNDQMWRNPAHQDNLALLRQRGIEIIEPGSGFLACGVISEGRLAEPEEIVAAVLQHFAPGPLTGRSVLVTAGGSREAIDAVRYIGNRSTGRMGIALAAAAKSMGARVTLLLGPTELEAPQGVDVQRFESAAQLAELCTKHAASADLVLMSAAVSDYRPSHAEAGKQKKEEGLPKIDLQVTDDILAGLGKSKPDGQRLIGFALETGCDDVVEANAAKKLAAKKLDLVCGNRADVDNEGFAGDRNRIYLLDAAGKGEWVGPMDKSLLARRILERVLELEAPTSAKERA
jgi:phosphopantothenoylcysteine decarboxylase/phosphopantothenate--cysteine ligase